MDKTGIEFTEEMTRLILDGKIVGYARLKRSKLSANLRFEYSAGVNWWLPVRNDEEDFYIKHDSFNQGIKVGDEYLFSGDRFEVGDHYIGDSRIKPFNGVLIFTDECRWEIEDPKDSDFNLDIWEIISGNVKYKKIGNIYD